MNRKPSMEPKPDRTGQSMRFRIRTGELARDGIDPGGEKVDQREPDEIFEPIFLDEALLTQSRS